MFFSKCYIVVPLLIFSLNCPAQLSLGMETGVSHNLLNADIQTRPSTVTLPGLGYSIALPLQYKINNWISLETGPSLIQKNYSINRTDSFAGVYESFINTFIELPLMVHLVYGGRVKLFADAGVYGGYWLAAKVKGAIPDIFSSAVTMGINGQNIESFQLSSFNEKYNFNNQTDNRFGYGWLAGAGLVYCVNKKYSLYMRTVFYKSLTGQQKNYMLHQIPEYNRTLLFSLGGMISINKR
jgi:hypothetical protein